VSIWSVVKKVASAGGKVIDKVASVGPLVLDLFGIKKKTVAGTIVADAEKAKSIKDALEEKPPTSG